MSANLTQTESQSGNVYVSEEERLNIQSSVDTTGG